MNSCSAAVLEEYPDIIFAYGFSDEYRFQIHFVGFIWLPFMYISSLIVFRVSSVVLYWRKRQDFTRDELGIDSSKPDPYA